MTFIDKIHQLEAAKQKVAELEKTVTTERLQALASLPAQFGYSDVNDFIKALKTASAEISGEVRRGARKVAKVKEAKVGGRRARITPELRDQVIAAVQAGKSGSEIADEFGISLPSVQNIKKAAGLVRARGSNEEAVAEVVVESVATEVAPV